MGTALCLSVFPPRSTSISARGLSLTVPPSHPNFLINESCHNCSNNTFFIQGRFAAPAHHTGPWRCHGSPQVASGLPLEIPQGQPHRAGHEHTKETALGTKMALKQVTCCSQPPVAPRANGNRRQASRLERPLQKCPPQWPNV